MPEENADLYNNTQFDEAELNRQLEEFQQSGQDAFNNYDVNDLYTDTAVNGGIAFFWLFAWLALTVVMIVSMWKIFTKANEPGWAALVPFYNAYVMLKIAGLPGWWLILFFIPFVNIIFGVIAIFYLVKSFGRGVGFAVATIFFPYITYPILAFGKSKYQGPAYKG